MYYEQTNVVALRTKKAISEAFLLLIQEREYDEISVSEICLRADVVRKTFYNHFQTKDDLIGFLIQDFTNALESLVDIRTMSVRQMLLIAFQIVMENRDMMLLFHDRGLFRFAHQSLMNYIVRGNLLEKLSEQVEDKRIYKYIAAQIPAVLISVVETWIETGMEESVEFLAELTEQLMIRPDLLSSIL